MGGPVCQLPAALLGIDSRKQPRGLGILLTQGIAHLPGAPVPPRRRRRAPISFIARNPGAAALLGRRIPAPSGGLLALSPLITGLLLVAGARLTLRVLPAAGLLPRIRPHAIRGMLPAAALQHLAIKALIVALLPIPVMIGALPLRRTVLRAPLTCRPLTARVVPASCVLPCVPMRPVRVLPALTHLLGSFLVLIS